MSVEYQAVQWNRQKAIYDFVLIGGVAIYLVTFGLVTEILFPYITAEIMLMRAFGTAAFVLLHIILCIGPLCRLNPKLLPLLYNRRHAGVTLFLLASVHAALVILTYHAGGDTNPLLSVFTTSKMEGSVASAPFQPFGFFALVILFLMAATSHDFWLANLTAPVWKTLHMLVYAAYGLLLLHVALGILQSEQSPVYSSSVFIGFATVLILHLIAGQKEIRKDRELTSPTDGGFVDVCAVADIPENRARIICLSGERVAIFKHAGKISAISNVCQHQNGPLGEGKVVDGCVTCPWHGYQYLPETGASPPPFTERVPTFNVRVEEGRVFVHPQPNLIGTKTPPASVD